ncbi:hypothetical protein X777_10310 [Ooceraea biroi]|uniref:Uncharacterized protein n=1 Tax=Ooceraea biroi TaxID=2015173 RepID=A0A026W4P4_OOCBI|nr:hypothetical protein X777_10310 [Ooceraea biroi]
MAGMRLPRYRSFSVYLSTRNSQLSRTQSHTSNVPSGLPEMSIKQLRKSCERTYSVLVALVMNLKPRNYYLNKILNNAHVKLGCHRLILTPSGSQWTVCLPSPSSVRFSRWDQSRV